MNIHDVIKAVASPKPRADGPLLDISEKPEYDFDNRDGNSTRKPIKCITNNCG